MTGTLLSNMDENTGLKVVGLPVIRASVSSASLATTDMTMDLDTFMLRPATNTQVLMLRQTACTSLPSRPYPPASRHVQQ